MILNSVQQNNKIGELKIVIEIKMNSNRLNIKYSDTGTGLSKEYLNKPEIILDAHETTRHNGHGLGMWIIHNTINLQKGKILNISGEGGFKFIFEMEEVV